jgi:hypothetical protein
MAASAGDDWEMGWRHAAGGVDVECGVGHATTECGREAAGANRAAPCTDALLRYA